MVRLKHVDNCVEWVPLLKLKPNGRHLRSAFSSTITHFNTMTDYEGPGFELPTLCLLSGNGSMCRLMCDWSVVFAVHHLQSNWKCLVLCQHFVLMALRLAAASTVSPHWPMLKQQLTFVSRWSGCCGLCSFSINSQVDVVEKNGLKPTT